MADSPTTRNRFRKQEPGAKANIWGLDLNEDGGSDRLDESLDGWTSITLGGGPVTLTSVNYETDQARKRVLNLAGTSGTVIIPAVEKWYLVRNGASGSAVISNGSNSVTVVTGEIVNVFTDGILIYKSVGKQYIDQAIIDAALSSELPAQAGNAGKYITTDGTNASWADLAAGDITGLDAAIVAQTDADIVAIAALTPTNDDIIQRKAGVWTNRTPAQVATDLYAAGAEAKIKTTSTITDVAGFIIDPTLGRYQSISIGADRTPTIANWANGYEVNLMLTGNGHVITSWSSTGVVWINRTNSPPPLFPSGPTLIRLWQVGGVLYGWYPTPAESGDITFVGYQTTKGSFTTSPITPTIALTGLLGGSDLVASPNDVAVIALITCIGTGDQNLSVTGFTEDADLFQTDTKAINLGVYWKAMTSTPDTTATLNIPAGTAGSSYCAIVQVWRGVDNTTPLATASTSALLASSALANPPSITPPFGRTVGIAIGAVAHDGPGGIERTLGSTTLKNFVSFGQNANNATTIGMGNFYDPLGAWDPAAFTFSATDDVTYSSIGYSMLLRRSGV